MKKLKERKVKLTGNGKADENYLALYFSEFVKYPLLNREEEEKTAKAAAAGDMKAREKLINSNLRFVVNVAKRYQGHGLPLEDLISEGNIGLINAVDRFDAGKGNHFITYAIWWIRQTILSALCEKSRMIRLPVNRVTELIRIEQAKKMINSNLSFNDEINEIAKICNMDKRHVIELINVSRDMLSLENPFSDNQELPLGDIIEDDMYSSPDKTTEKKMLKDDIDIALDSLNKSEAEILRSHYGLGSQSAMTLKEIGQRYNISKERVRQIEVKALGRLRHPARRKMLQSYVA
ncbi:MAG: RNA polymerase sigma factor RpoD/SigA [Treponema sp.]|jgi:RNA polymerase primary sigma factor|nr:RNA polymerase sigma factor RpoD/SigA [Treponema sp.]